MRLIDGDALLDAILKEEWIPITFRELTEEEQKEHPEWCYYLDCDLPDDGDEIIVTNGKYVWKDECIIEDAFYLDSGNDWRELTAWMPLPEPYKEGGENHEID